MALKNLRDESKKHVLQAILDVLNQEANTESQECFISVIKETKGLIKQIKSLEEDPDLEGLVKEIIIIVGEPVADEGKNGEVKSKAIEEFNNLVKKKSIKKVSEDEYSDNNEDSKEEDFKIKEFDSEEKGDETPELSQAKSEEHEDFDPGRED